MLLSSILPLILIMILSSLLTKVRCAGGGGDEIQDNHEPEKLFSLRPTHEYNEKRFTQEDRVVYYVKRGFDARRVVCLCVYFIKSF